MFILKTGHQPGVYVPLRALFLVGLPVHHNAGSLLQLHLLNQGKGQSFENKI